MPILQYSRLLIYAVLFLAVPFGAGCKSRPGDSTSTGFQVTSVLPIAEYVHMSVGANGVGGTKKYFPLLQVYDLNGKLVHVSHDAKTNSQFLDNLPRTLQGLQPISNALPLPVIAHEIPALDRKMTAIMSRHNFTIVVVSLDGCHACSIQESALDESQNEISRQGMNLVRLQITK